MNLFNTETEIEQDQIILKFFYDRLIFFLKRACAVHAGILAFLTGEKRGKSSLKVTILLPQKTDLKSDDRLLQNALFLFDVRRKQGN